MIFRAAIYNANMTRTFTSYNDARNYLATRGGRKPARNIRSRECYNERIINEGVVVRTVFETFGWEQVGYIDEIPVVGLTA